MRRALIMLAVVLCLGAMMLAGGEVMGASGQRQGVLPDLWRLEDGNGRVIEYVENMKNSTLRRYANGEYAGYISVHGAGVVYIYDVSGRMQFTVNVIKPGFFEVIDPNGNRKFYVESIRKYMAIITDVDTNERYYLYGY